jgi:hypothetical protein
VQLVEGGGSLPTELLGAALEAVARGLSTARQHLERAAGQLAALQGAAAWSQALLAAADACLHSERWHAAWHAEAAGGKEAYARTVALARDMLKQDLLPLLCDAAAQQTGASGFCLAPQYQALLAMGGCGLPLAGGRAGWPRSSWRQLSRQCHPDWQPVPGHSWPGSPLRSAFNCLL